MASPRRRGPTWVWDYLLPPVVYLACFTLLTWPALRWFSSAYMLGSDDGFQNIWNLWWVDKSLTQLHQSPFYTTWLHAPAGTTLVGHTLNPFNGLLAIPLRRVMSPEATYNTIIVFSFVVGGWTTYALARAVSGSRAGALLAGFLFTFSAFHFAHATSHLQLVALEWVPLCLLGLLRLMEKPMLPRALAAAGAVLLVALCDYYYLLYSAIAGVLLYAVMAGAKRDIAFGLRRPHVVPLLALVAASLATTGVLVAQVIIANQRDPFFGAHSATIYYTDLLAPFIPGGSWVFHTWTERYWSVFPAGWVEMSVYVGWGAIVLAVIAWRRRRESAAPTAVAWCVVMALVFFVLSLGPELRVWGLKTGGPMPYALLERFVPIFRLSGLPVRMMVMVSLALAVLAACGWAALARSPASPRRNLIMAALLGLIIFETWPRPLPITSHPIPAWVHALQDLPPGSYIDAHTHPAHSLYYQTIHEKPFAFGYISREPASVATEKLRKLLAARTGDVATLRSAWGFDYFVTPATMDVPAATIVYDDGETRIYSLRPSL
ncbi:MAG TPA: hypothetical protein VGR35_19075 [Tepidisphaeraceae bacterium]|nr:hypothetical protein [Tepidisphaeraceae bacterium]